MAGIYVHIPFCKKLCYYCDFHFTVSFKNKDAVINSILKEIGLRKMYLAGDEIATIYLGGGTPSVLDRDEINAVFEAIYKNYNVSESAEITLEANPDDLSPEYLKMLYEDSPVNRLSIGVQSFRDMDLKMMNRRHNATEAISVVHNSQKAGFDNINIDLIYGIPGLDFAGWKENLAKAFLLEIQHISAYHLTFEPKTVFSRFLSQGKIKPVEESLSYRQFEWLLTQTSKQGFIHYEISNFAKEGFFSQHNTNYWRHEKYLGIGPSAHSFDLSARQWNIANNTRYVEALENDTLPFEKEIITPGIGYNDYLLTSLRTMWGAKLTHITEKYGQKFADYFIQQSGKFIANGEMVREEDDFVLSRKGKFMSDYIISDLMFVAD